MLRLMIVDDEEIIRQALSQMIDYRSLGYELVAAAKNGMEAYDIICDEYPDVVITDIRMPILNGLELIKRAVKADPQITFILLSGYSEFEYAKQAMSYGVRHYLLKPTDKQELIDALTAIQKERLEKEGEKEEALKQERNRIRSLMEYHFLMESLTAQEPFQKLFERYRPWFAFPEAPPNACICSFVEEPYLSNFADDAARALQKMGTPLLFPILYVKNSAVLVFSCPSLSQQTRVQECFDLLRYDKQSVSFSYSFLSTGSAVSLFQEIIGKISRFERILFVSPSDGIREIHNDPASLWRISGIRENLNEELLNSLFPESISMDSARNIALGLFMQSHTASGPLQTDSERLDYACDFFRKLYSCPDVSEIRKLAQVALLQSTPASKTNANTALIKEYVNHHLDSEELSLKWLAENYLFVSVGYLSKQFLKEEGIRFSDYLNSRRMEEAKRLMSLYHNDNIKIIAAQVGFGNNPTYFSQVFKKYTGMTPTEYMEQKTHPA